MMMQQMVLSDILKRAISACKRFHGNFSHPDDADCAKSIIRELRNHGDLLNVDPYEVKLFALEIGYDNDGAKDFSEWIKLAKEGKSFRLNDKTNAVPYDTLQKIPISSPVSFQDGIKRYFVPTTPGDPKSQMALSIATILKTGYKNVVMLTPNVGEVSDLRELLGDSSYSIFQKNGFHSNINFGNFFLIRQSIGSRKPLPKGDILWAVYLENQLEKIDESSYGFKAVILTPWIDRNAVENTNIFKNTTSNSFNEKMSKDPEIWIKKWNAEIVKIE